MLKHILLSLIAASVLVCGCQPKETAPAKASEDTAKDDTAKDGDTAKDDTAKRKITKEEILDFKLKMKKQGQVAPPQPLITLNITGTNDKISQIDAERSYIFRKGEITRCYMIALIDDLKYTGTVDMTIANKNDKTELLKYENSIANDAFKECIRNAVVGKPNWPLPKDAQIDVTLKFASRPAPTIEEMKKANAHIEEHDHAHGAHHAADDIPAAPAAPAAPVPAAP